MHASERVSGSWCELPPRATAGLRIVLFTRALGFGGAERQIVHLANGLALRGHQVTVATLYSGTGFAAELRRPNPDLISLSKGGRWDLVGFTRRLLRYFRAAQPDVIYAFLPVPNLLATLVRTMACRRAALVWGLRGTPLDLSEYDWLARLVARTERQLARTADLLITNATAATSWAREAGLPAERIAVVANGIDSATIQPASPSERQQVRSQLGCRPDATVVAVVARLDPMKDHSSFLQAFAGAVAEDPTLQALIAGEGTPAFTAGLHSQAAALGIADRVIWLSPRGDVTTVYHAADLLCLPSAFGEGFPNVLGEAMAAGLRCIATNVGDSATVLGPNGVVVPPRDVPALRQAILDCARISRQGTPYDSRARQYVVETFSIGRMVESTEALLRRLVASSDLSAE